MDGTTVAQVRRFNRLVAERVGLFTDRFLSRDRSYGESRVLWEIGEAGSDLRSLRSRLALDSGYLSRVLRALEADGLVTVTPSASDKRVRTARLTAAGQAERAVIERRSDRLAVSLLEPLNEGQRDRLVAAMNEVERLLTASLVEFTPRDPLDPDAQYCLREYFAELDRRFDGGFVPERSRYGDAHEFRPPAGLFLVATLRSEPVGGGVLKFHENAPPEIKRMWVAPSTRGLGIGRRLLEELEARAAASGSSIVRLDTNRALTEAIAMYRSTGWVEVAPFNDEPYAHHWFEKQLGPSTNA